MIKKVLQSVYIIWGKQIMAGKQVRVKREIENVISIVANKLGYENYTIRNVALVYGLIILGLTKQVPKDDIEFKKMFKLLESIIRCIV